MNLLYWLLILIGVTAGALSTFYLVVSMIAVIVYKIYRKVKYGLSLYD
ncbi:MAG: hypothetical protein ACI4FY_06460 [Acetatifactor sp.]